MTVSAIIQRRRWRSLIKHVLDYVLDDGLNFLLSQAHVGKIASRMPVNVLEPFPESLLLFFLTTFITTLLLLLRSSSLLPPHSSRTAPTKWRRKSEIDMLLGVESDDEGRDVDNLLSNTKGLIVSTRLPQSAKKVHVPNMPLPNQDPCVMNTLCQAQFVDTGLQSSLQEVLHLESQHVIELHSGLIKHAYTNETANERITFEEALGVFLLHGQKLTGYRRYY